MLASVEKKKLNFIPKCEKKHPNNQSKMADTNRKERDRFKSNSSDDDEDEWWFENCAFNLCTHNVTFWWENKNIVYVWWNHTKKNDGLWHYCA